MFTESADLYDAIYSFKDYAAEAAQIAAVVRATHPQAHTILDVACGTGEHARHLAASHGFDVDGLDLDPGLLGVAREKHPSASFFEADMSDFALEKRYGVVQCLFSSIGYLVTLERTRRALECFRRHLRPGGVVLVEPWFPPGVLEDGRVFCFTGTHRGMAVERVSRNEIDGRISRLWSTTASRRSTAFATHPRSTSLDCSQGRKWRRRSKRLACERNSTPLASPAVVCGWYGLRRDRQFAAVAD